MARPHMAVPDWWYAWPIAERLRATEIRMKGPAARLAARDAIDTARGRNFGCDGMAYSSFRFAIREDAILPRWQSAPCLARHRTSEGDRAPPIFDITSPAGHHATILKSDISIAADTPRRVSSRRGGRTTIGDDALSIRRILSRRPCGEEISAMPTVAAGHFATASLGDAPMRRG